jgi:ornithine carbamoyltransferase
MIKNKTTRFKFVVTNIRTFINNVLQFSEYGPISIPNAVSNKYHPSTSDYLTIKENNKRIEVDVGSGVMQSMPITKKRSSKKIEFK